MKTGFASAAFFLVITAAVVFAVIENYWVGVPFLLIFFNGFAYTAALSLFSKWTEAHPPTVPAGLLADEAGPGP